MSGAVFGDVPLTLDSWKRNKMSYLNVGIVLNSLVSLDQVRCL